MGLIRRPKMLLIIRHAQSLRNVAKRGRAFFGTEDDRKKVSGIPDHMVPLTALGVEQAITTSPLLRATYGVPDKIFLSGYRRTRETTEGLLVTYTDAERALIETTEDIRLRERDPGYTYDMTEAEALRFFPYLQAYWDTFGPFFAKPPGGESFAEMSQRLHDFKEEVFNASPNQVLWFVTHGGPIRLFRFLLEHWPHESITNWQHPSPGNCGITVYKFDPRTGEPILVQYNQLFCEQGEDGNPQRPVHAVEQAP